MAPISVYTMCIAPRALCNFRCDANLPGFVETYSGHMCQYASYNIKTRIAPVSASMNSNATLSGGGVGGAFWPTILIVIVSGGKSLFVEAVLLYWRAW